MTKLRSDSVWTKLTPEQWAKLESWLFEQHLSYRETLELVRQEFGMTTSLTSLYAYRQRMTEERELRWEHDALVELLDIGGRENVDVAKLRAAGEKLLAVRALRLGIESPGQVKQLTTMTRVMIRGEDVDLRKRRIALQDKRLEWQMSLQRAKLPRNESSDGQERSG